MQFQVANGEGVRGIPESPRPRSAQFANPFVNVSRRPVRSGRSIPLAFTFLQFLLFRIFDHGPIFEAR